MKKALHKICKEYLKYDDIAYEETSPFWGFVKTQTEKVTRHYYGYDYRTSFVKSIEVANTINDFIIQLEDYIERIVNTISIESHKGNKYICNMLIDLGYDERIDLPFENIVYSKLMAKMVEKGYFSFDYFIEAFVEDYQTWQRGQGTYNICYRGINENIDKQLKVKKK